MCVRVCACVPLQNLTYLGPNICQLLELQEFYRTAAADESPVLTAHTEVPHISLHPHTPPEDMTGGSDSAKSLLV